MAERCPTCGQPLPDRVPPISLHTVIDLIEALSKPAPVIPTKWQIKHNVDVTRRDVFRGRYSNDWFVCHGGGRVAWETVKAAIDRGLLRETYPGISDSWTLVVRHQEAERGDA